MELRGEDQIAGMAGTPFALRFHLHPAMELSLALDGQSALIKTPKRHVFRIRLAEGAWQVEESLYFGARGRKEKAQQLVLHGAMQPDPFLARWALSRENRR
jgi:uncharacterized heparinase superfamily protein